MYERYPDDIPNQKDIFSGKKKEGISSGLFKRILIHKHF